MKARLEHGENPDTRLRILESAAAVFARKGYHETRIDDIAAESGTSKGAFYFHWPSKEGIFLALIDSFASLLEQRLLERLAGSRGGTARLDAALSVCVETFGRYKSLAKIALVQAAGLGMGFERKRMEVGERFIGIIRDNIERAVAEGGIPPVDACVAAHAWMGALNEIIMRWIQTGRPDPVEVLPELRRLLLRSIGALREDEDSRAAPVKSAASPDIAT